MQRPRPKRGKVKSRITTFIPPINLPKAERRERESIGERVNGERGIKT
jgi:hypothetical protein